MTYRKTILFIILSIAFASTHYFAMTTSLYWYFWWFDILMHFWGGILLGLGVHTFTSFSFIKLKPTLKLVLLTLLIATLTWEIFEWATDLYDPIGHYFDTTKDIIMGFSGGLLAHIILTKRTIRS